MGAVGVMAEPDVGEEVCKTELVFEDLNLPVCLCEPRHQTPLEGVPPLEHSWKLKERMRTVSVALVVCMNVGVDPPDVVKTQPCARLECWIDPLCRQAPKALEKIGASLQRQYERWQPRARYKQSLDPTAEDVKKLCISLRRNAKEERVLFHYNGHGVPRPTINGEIWVFNRNFTQYIPLSIYDLQLWLGAPSIYVYDCSNAGIIVDSFHLYAAQHEREWEQVKEKITEHMKMMQPANDPTDDKEGSDALKDNLSKSFNITGSPPNFNNCIQLAACRADQSLPMNPDLPADLFTSCLTTPIKMCLRWYILNGNPRLMTPITLDMIDRIPGVLSDRRTMLGELNWIFTAVTDTIAWNTLPKDLFLRLFRQDLLVASLFRNFLLAERIMRSCDCTPISSPALPPTHQHRMWQTWDYILDLSLSQLPGILQNNKPYNYSPFFEQQLTAFELWLDLGYCDGRSPPEQLPIVLQVLLSQAHRVRALELLGRFLNLGPWAVNLALSVGIFPYVLKLLQSSAKELRTLLVYIWARILAVDKGYQSDLIREGGHKYFLGILDDHTLSSDHRTDAAFVLSQIVTNFREGQEMALYASLMSVCLEELHENDEGLRQWSAICVGRLWERYEKARWCGVRDNAHERLFMLLGDRRPEVRAAAAFALGTFLNALESKDSDGRRSEHAINIDHAVAMQLMKVLQVDISPIVRMELVNALQWMVLAYSSVFQNMCTRTDCNGGDGGAVDALLFLTIGSSIPHSGSGGRRVSAGAAQTTPRTNQAVAADHSLWSTQRWRRERITSAQSASAGLDQTDSGVSSGSSTVTGPLIQDSGGGRSLLGNSSNSMKRVSSSSAIHGSPLLNQRLMSGSGSSGSGSATSLSCITSGVPSLSYGSIYMKIWNCLLVLECDPYPDVAKMSKCITRYVRLLAQRRAQLQRQQRMATAHNSSGGSSNNSSVGVTQSVSLPPSPNNSRGYVMLSGGDAGIAENRKSPMISAVTTTPTPSTNFSARYLFSRRQSPTTSTSKKITSSSTGATTTKSHTYSGSGSWTLDRPLGVVSPTTEKQSANIDIKQIDIYAGECLVNTEYTAWASNRLMRKTQWTDTYPVNTSAMASSTRKKDNTIIDSESQEAQNRDWIVIRNKNVQTTAWKEQCLWGRYKLDTQVFNTRTALTPAIVRFHPYDQQIVVAGKDHFGIWDWSTNTKTTVCQNKSYRYATSRISALEWMNGHDLASMVVVASDDGSVRVWRPNAGQGREPSLVSAWQVCQNDLRVNKLGNCGVVMAWDQCNSILVTAGDTSRTIRFWDVQAERHAHDIGIGTDALITSIDATDRIGPVQPRRNLSDTQESYMDDGYSHSSWSGNVVVVGCDDGSVRLFDRRTGDSKMRVWMDHTAAIQRVQLLQRSNLTAIISASTDGEVKMYDIRKHDTLLMNSRPMEDLSCFQAHQHADVFACGSTSNSIVLHSLWRGALMNTIKVYEGFMGHRTGTIVCLAFHPYRALLAAGTYDCSLSVFSLEGVRR